MGVYVDCAEEAFYHVGEELGRFETGEKGPWVRTSSRKRLRNFSTYGLKPSETRLLCGADGWRGVAHRLPEVERVGYLDRGNISGVISHRISTLEVCEKRETEVSEEVSVDKRRTDEMNYVNLESVLLFQDRK